MMLIMEERNRGLDMVRRGMVCKRRMKIVRIVKDNESVRWFYFCVLFLVRRNFCKRFDM